MASYDWTSEESGGYDLLYEATCLQPTTTGRQWYALATARLQKKFIGDQPSEVCFPALLRPGVIKQHQPNLSCLNPKVDTPLFATNANPLQLCHSPRVKILAFNKMDYIV